MSQFEYQQGRYYKDGRPYFVVASDYQYYRDRRDHWRDRLEKLKAAGVELITFYTPWRHHLQWSAGRPWYDFEGRTKDSRDLKGFLQRIADVGLLMIVKPGPFVHSELNVGGLPDFVCPTFNPEMPPARRHHGGPCYWTYDASQLPEPLDERFDRRVEEWLGEVGRIIAPFATPGGPLVGLQLNDETIYCTSNDPPWHIGYEPSGMAYYHKLLAERYGDLATYNRLHGTDYPSLAMVPGPRLRVLEDKHPGAPGPQRKEDLLSYIDWAEFQWRLRRDLYQRYERYLGISHLPYLTNYAGITPPIEENVPDLQEVAQETIPPDFTKTYAEWWFAMNRIDHDRDVYEYGMISWLGVAAFDQDVFDRYLNTARRARGINMEENWGFAALYDERSKYPIVPFFQTLLSIAGGATGYDIFVGVSTDYWDDTLDRITKLQCSTFPSDAPIDEHGNTRPLYDTAKMMNRWFLEHGQSLLSCELDVDCAYLLYAPYAAVSGWVPDDRYWHLAEHDIPRCGYQGFEEFSRSLQAAGFSFGMFELDAATESQMREPASLAMQTAFFMDQPSQQRLADYIASGGRLLLSGELPSVDLQWQPCTILKDAVQAAGRGGNVVYRRENLFADHGFAGQLSASGLKPNVTYSDHLRAYVHRGEHDLFVFFFDLGNEEAAERFVEFYGQRIELRLGPKTSGVVRVHDGKLAGHLVKGENEADGVRADVRIQLGEQTIEGRGDFSSCG